METFVKTIAVVPGTDRIALRASARSLYAAQDEIKIQVMRLRTCASTATSRKENECPISHAILRK
jgi:hypothetical protein